MTMVRILGATSLMLLISTTSLFYLYGQEKEKRVKAESALGQVNLTLAIERENSQRQADKLLLLNTDMALIQSRSDMLTNQMNEYRDREKLLQKRPKSVERLANAATNRVFNGILRASSSTYDKDKTAKPGTDSGN